MRVAGRPERMLPMRFLHSIVHEFTAVLIATGGGTGA
jgi:hypothetical protein